LQFSTSPNKTSRFIVISGFIIFFLNYFKYILSLKIIENQLMKNIINMVHLCAQLKLIFNKHFKIINMLKMDLKMQELGNQKLEIINISLKNDML